MKNHCRGILIACLFILSGTTQASLIAMGDYTTDTATGLDWLDLDLSLGLSLNQVNAQLGVGGLFEGYQVATLVQAQTFLTNAGWIGVFDTSNNLNAGFVASFKSQTTSFTNDPVGGMGSFTDDPLGDLGWVRLTNDPLGELGFTNDPLDDLGLTTYSITSPITSDFTQQYTGTFLFRASAVPVPAAMWLFVSGLVVLMGSARHKKTS